jgi:hypothetical protein
MRTFLGTFLIILMSTALVSARETGSRAQYVGGTMKQLADSGQGRLGATDNQKFTFASKKKSIEVPYSQINMIEYGQKVDRRYAMALLVSPMFLLSKKRQHFLTLGYTDEAGQQQALIFRVEKGDIRAILVSLEARTGRRVQYQDNEARKAGKG